MKIIKPTFEIWPRDEQRGGLAIIERAGRLCYQSKPGKTPESAEKFARRLIYLHHNSVLEHGDMIFEISNHQIYDAVYEALRMIRDNGDQPPMLEMTSIGYRYIVSGNIRAWRELFATGSGAGAYFIGWFDPAFVHGYGFYNDELTGVKDDRIRQIFYRDLKEPGEKRAHLRQTVHFVCDRAIANEFVRHRVMSFAQESTRYVDYASEHEIEVVEPSFLLDNMEAYGVWKRQCMTTESSYNALRRMGYPPQKCRNVLSLSNKTELAMTGNLRAWNHFFDLWARQTTGPVHPQAVELALPLMREMATRFPDVIGQ